MKESVLVGLIAGILAGVVFTAGVQYGKHRTVIKHCEGGTLYIGVGPADDMLIAEVVYPLEDTACE